jgi:hypothetical protein
MERFFNGGRTARRPDGEAAPAEPKQARRRPVRRRPPPHRVRFPYAWAKTQRLRALMLARGLLADDPERD